MANSIGQILKITIFGESHQKGVGLIIDNLPSGIFISEEKIKERLKNRKTHDELSTKRDEEDNFIFISGVFNHKTDGSPLAFYIENNDINSSFYQKGEIRPGHADITYYQKYLGYNDFRGGGFSSGRVATSFIVLSVILDEILDKYDIKVMTHIKKILEISDRNFISLKDDYKILDNNPFPTLDKNICEKYKEKIREIKKKNDSVGGTLETLIFNVPKNLGEPYFLSLESYISSLIFSLGGVKGISFGDINLIDKKLGSEFNDQMEFKNGKLTYITNHAGGILGGISTGENIIFETKIKPTPSIKKEQKTINLEKGINENLNLDGRFDPTILHRIAPLINSLVKFVIVDLMMIEKGKNI